MRPLACAILLALPFLLVLPAREAHGARRVIRELPVIEIPASSGIVPVAFCVDEQSRVTVADDGGGVLLHYDAAGRLEGRTALLLHPELSRFRLRDVAVRAGAFYVLETVKRRILIYDGGRRSTEISLPAECVLPLQIGFDPFGRVTVHDGHSARTLALDAKGRIVAQTDRRIDDGNAQRRAVLTCAPTGEDGRGVALYVAAALDAPGREVYKLIVADPIAGVEPLGIDRTGDLLVRLVTGYGLELTGAIARIGEQGVRKSLVDYARFPETATPRPLLLAEDGKIYALRRFPEASLIVRLEEQMDYDSE